MLYTAVQNSTHELYAAVSNCPHELPIAVLRSCVCHTILLSCRQLCQIAEDLYQTFHVSFPVHRCDEERANCPYKLYTAVLRSCTKLPWWDVHSCAGELYQTLLMGCTQHFCAEELYQLSSWAVHFCAEELYQTVFISCTQHFFAEELKLKLKFKHLFAGNCTIKQITVITKWRNSNNRRKLT
jgi:hypothetical protein